MGYRIGVDVGGSFTDFAVMSDDMGELYTLKVYSRPDAPGEEIAEAFRILHERHGISPSAITYFNHGTTVGINTVIQRNGMKLALFTTRGFEDVLEMGRLKVPHIHDLFSRRAEPLIPRERVFGIDERMNAQGGTVTPVDPASVAAAVQAARRAGAQAIVVAFLHSYRNEAHERRVCELIHEISPDLPAFGAADIWPVIREYERTITATINGYVQPRVAHYLDRFEQTLLALGIAAPLRITKSNGGIMGAAQARAECVQMILSGTASGVMGAAYIARSCSFDKILSLDIGGTSADIATIIDGNPEYSVGEIIGDFQIHIPSVSVTSIGQGGGSIAWVDTHDVLHVGPESAGSTPGPACYGRGGMQPTLTDAMAVCGLLGHAPLGYNAVHLDCGAAQAAMRPLAGRLHVSIEAVAQSIIELAVSGMYTDASAVISRFGIDQRDYYIMAFGGAGPMAACFLARALEMKGVIVPPAPGVLSALGGLIAGLRNDFIRILYMDVNAGNAGAIGAAFDALEARARHWLHEEQGHAGTSVVSCVAEMRYQGQSFEVVTDIDPQWIASRDMAAMRDAFHARHHQLFGHRDDDAIVQVINLRLMIEAPVAPPPPRRLARADTPIPTPIRVVDVWLDGSWCRACLYARHDLRAGHAFSGPAIVAQDDCTTCIPSDFKVRIDDYGNMIINHVAQPAGAC